MGRQRGPEALSINRIVKLKKDPGESQGVDDVGRGGARHASKGRTNDTINKVLGKPSVAVELVHQTPRKTAPIRPTNNILHPKPITNSINNAPDIIMREPRCSKFAKPGLIIIELIKNYPAKKHCKRSDNIHKDIGARQIMVLAIIKKQPNIKMRKRSLTTIEPRAELGPTTQDLSNRNKKGTDMRGETLARNSTKHNITISTGKKGGALIFEQLLKNATTPLQGGESRQADLKINGKYRQAKPWETV